ncbi:MAG: diguanylate cyclase [Thermoleophilaceae bacterium]
MTHHALHDALSGLPNRVLLIDRLKLALVRARRGSFSRVCCSSTSIVGRRLNDSASGHQVGDEVLVEVAWRLDGGIRGGDTIARMGGTSSSSCARTSRTRARRSIWPNGSSVWW